MKRAVIFFVFLAAIFFQNQNLIYAWDIAGRYELYDPEYKYTVTVDVNRNYEIHMETARPGGLCTFDGLIKNKKKVAKQLSASPSSIDVVVWNKEKNKEFSDDFIFQFTPTSVVVMQGPSEGSPTNYCGISGHLPGPESVMKKVK